MPAKNPDTQASHNVIEEFLRIQREAGKRANSPATKGFMKERSPKSIAGESPVKRFWKDRKMKRDLFR